MGTFNSFNPYVENSEQPASCDPNEGAGPVLVCAGQARAQGKERHLCTWLLGEDAPAQRQQSG